MEVASKADVKMIGRAIKEWLGDDAEKRSLAVNALYDVVINNEDPEMKALAFRALVQADMADLKREEVALKKQALDDAKRFRLLELVRNLPPRELAKLAPSNAGDDATGRASEGQGAESQGESI